MSSVNTSHRGHRSDKWADRWAVALACTGCLLLTALLMPGWVQVARNEGTWGTFTAVYEDCQPRVGCSWTGRFTSDDGTIHTSGATFEGGAVEHPGDRVRGQVVSGDYSTVYASHDRSWLWAGAFDVGAVAYLAWWGKTRRWRRVGEPPSRSGSVEQPRGTPTA